MMLHNLKTNDIGFYFKIQNTKLLHTQHFCLTGYKLVICDFYLHESYNHALHYHVTKFRSMQKHFLIFKFRNTCTFTWNCLFCVSESIYVLYIIAKESHMFSKYIFYIHVTTTGIYIPSAKTLYKKYKT